MKRSVVCAVMALVLVSSASARAQNIGPLSWQMNPYCNVIALVLVPTAVGFRLEGTDNLCGAAAPGSALGLATFNADGSVGLNFSIVVPPDARTVHVSAQVSPASGAGTWRDSAGHAGAFAFAQNAGGLPPRPLPTSGLAAGAITARELAAGAVGSAQLASGAVTGATVADGSLTMTDIADGPRASIAGGNQNLTLTSTLQIVRSVTVTAPASGLVVVNASAYLLFGSSGTNPELVRCSISATPALDFNALTTQSDGSLASGVQTAMASTRGFAVPAGSFTAYFVCDAPVLVGSANNQVSIWDSQMTAVWVR